MTTHQRPRVLVLESMYHPDGEELLSRHAEVEFLRDSTPETIRNAIRTVLGIYVRYPCRLHGDAIQAGSNLLVISTSGRGTDAIDLKAATERGIAVVNNPGLGSVPVTEHTLGLMLDLAKQISRSNIELRSGKGWGEGHKSTRFHLEGRTLGVIGCGQIGTEMVRKCTVGFGMRVLVYDPYVLSSKAEAVGGTWVKDLGQLLRESDFVSLHPELTEETRGMIGEAELRLMRGDAYLINTARGPVVQQKALLRALDEGWITGAALDVFDPEPPPADSPLYAQEKLVLTPHVAGLTVEARRDLAMSAAAQILQVLQGERPSHLVNPEVWGRLEPRLPVR